MLIFSLFYIDPVIKYYKLYRVSHSCCANAREIVEQAKLSPKVLYNFAIFAIANELLITTDR